VCHRYACLPGDGADGHNVFNFKLSIFVIINSIKHNSAKADNLLAGHKIPFLLWIPKVRYCEHSNPPLVSILSQLNPVPNLNLIYLNQF
jgi:hypothetical protein